MPATLAHVVDDKLVATYEIPAKPGERLPNGATLLAEHVVRKGGGRTNGRTEMRESIVLCIFGPSAQPFVTWSRWVSLDNTATGSVHVVDTCAWGHYHSDLEVAIREYKSRLGKKGRQG